ncbi:lytic transglycosylase domain-containing protein [Clostridium sp.]|uniref:lytic transglycosylase domain-containing protein n=1 Tax=Clostridium sp. TaxID=1506 RepID=UPI002624F16E|nr:lytic transglycosylase domain-containing protein [Clostridium sp.]
MSSINGISNNQLISALGNNNLTGDTSNESNLAFALMMENLTNSKENNSNSASSEKIQQQTRPGQDLKEIAMRLNKNFKITYDSSGSYNKVTTSSNDEQMKQIYNSVNKAASKYGVDPNLILAIIKHESDFQPNVTSSAGATGLMQIMPENYGDYGITDGYDIDQNVDGGTKLLKTCLDLYGGDLQMGLMAYAAGPGTMQKRGVTSGADLYKMPDETKKAVPEIIEEYRNRSKTS